MQSFLLPTLASLTAARPLSPPPSACLLPPLRAVVQACDVIEVVPSGETTSSDDCSVFLMNDSFNMREYVARVLMMVCDLDEEKAEMIMMEANWNYSTRIGTWKRPVANHILEGLQKAGLHANLVEENEST